MVKLNENDWIQWDNQIKTFRAQINGILYGKYSYEFSTLAEIVAQTNLNLSEDQTQELNDSKNEDIT